MNPTTGELRFRATGDLKRAQRAFPWVETDKWLIEQTLAGVEALVIQQHRRGRIEDEAGLRAFVEGLGGQIRLTLPRPLPIRNFEADVEAVVRRLVEAPVERMAAVYAPPRAVPVVRVPTPLQDVFDRLSDEGRVRTPGLVRVPELGTELEIPYAYQNGELNLVKPEVFKGKGSTQGAFQLGGKGRLLAKHADEGGAKRRLIVVAAAGSTPSAEEKAAGLMKDFDVEFVPQSGAAAFAERVERDAH